MQWHYLTGLNLRDKAKAKFKELSGGQKQRFSIATTLINKPKIIFLDEPTTGLDPQARRNLWDLVKEIRSKGTTLIITTHYMDEAEILCDRVAIIDSGNIIAMASPDKLIDELVASGFEKPKEVKQANLEDVFIHLTGKHLRSRITAAVNFCTRLNGYAYFCERMFIMASYKDQLQREIIFRTPHHFTCSFNNRIII